MSSLGIRAAHDKLTARNGEHGIGDVSAGNCVGVSFHFRLRARVRAGSNAGVKIRNRDIIVIRQRRQAAESAEGVSSPRGFVDLVLGGEFSTRGFQEYYEP